MKNLKFKSITVMLLILAWTAIANAQTTYWLGVKDGDKLVFKVQVPADAAAVIKHNTKAPAGDEKTTPRYRTFTADDVVFHANEIAWETKDVSDGSLTFVTNAGAGSEWKYCNIKNPLWNDFFQALKNMATPYGSTGWSQAKVIMTESGDPTEPTAKLNLDGTFGEKPIEKVAEKPVVVKAVEVKPVIAEAGSKRCPNVTTPLTDTQIDEILRVHNEARAEVGTPPIKWNCDLAAYAQKWAENDDWEHSNPSERKRIIEGGYAGENLAADTESAADVGKLVLVWVKEKSDWTNSTATCTAGKQCGHYTAVVWKTTTDVGCGIIHHSNVMGDDYKGHATFMVCNYYPGKNSGEAAF